MSRFIPHKFSRAQTIAIAIVSLFAGVTYHSEVTHAWNVVEPYFAWILISFIVVLMIILGVFWVRLWHEQRVSKQHESSKH